MESGNEELLDYQTFALSFAQKGAIEYFAEHLSPEDVGIPSGNTGVHEFYLALLDFYHRTGLDVIEPISFRSWLESETEICSALGGPVVVQSFIEHISGLELSTPEAVTKVLKDKSNTRKQLNAIEELKLVVSRKDVKTDTDKQRLTQLTEQIRVLSRSIQYNPYDSIETGIDIAVRAENIWDLPDFLPTQFPELNKALGYSELGGPCKGAVHAILAQSGQGKSTLAKCFMNHWVINGKRVLFVNYEEAVAHWERVLFTQITEQNPYKFTDLQDRAKYNKIYQDTLKEWGELFMVKHDPETPYFDDLERWIYDLVGYNNNVPDAIIIDTIQSMFVKGSGNKPRWGQFEEMMVRLEKLAKDTNAAVLITAQENTNRMKENREEVKQSDSGGSITIMQKSSAAIFLVKKKEADKDDSESDLVMELQIPKNRITGGMFTQRPPLVVYNDSSKSFEPFHLPEIADDGQYSNWALA